MKLTAELSLYPLQDDYIAIVQGFIDALRGQTDLQVAGNTMSTQICGDYDRVFGVISELLATSTRRFGKQVLVVKFIPWELELVP